MCRVVTGDLTHNTEVSSVIISEISLEFNDMQFPEFLSKSCMLYHIWSHSLYVVIKASQAGSARNHHKYQEASLCTMYSEPSLCSEPCN